MYSSPLHTEYQKGFCRASQSNRGPDFHPASINLVWVCSPAFILPSHFYSHIFLTQRDSYRKTQAVPVVIQANKVWRIHMELCKLMMQWASNTGILTVQMAVPQNQGCIHFACRAAHIRILKSGSCVSKCPVHQQKWTKPPRSEEQAGEKMDMKSGKQSSASTGRVCVCSCHKLCDDSYCH